MSILLLLFTRLIAIFAKIQNKIKLQQIYFEKTQKNRTFANYFD